MATSNENESDPLLSLEFIGNELKRAPETFELWIEQGLLKGERFEDGTKGVRKSVILAFYGKAIGDGLLDKN